MSALKMREISKTYGSVRANDDINLEVRKGEVHGLLGENGAGKTTLMNILFGLVAPDRGSIEINGSPASITSPKDATKLGVGMVHQHFQLVPTLTVAENIALGDPGPMLRLNLTDLSDRLAETAERYGLAIDPSALVSQLSVGEQQRVELLKLLYYDVNILVLDEPTAVLTSAEWTQVSNLMKRLTEDGKSIIFISHKLGEHHAVSDRCTILRHGKTVGTVAMDNTNDDEIIQLMVGRDIDRTFELLPVDVEPTIMLEVTGLHSVAATGLKVLSDINLELRAGETLGIAGVDGNGQEELVDALVGLLPIQAGEIKVLGEPVKKMSPAIWRRKGGALITADRHRTAVSQDLDLCDNLTITELDNKDLFKNGFYKHEAVNKHVDQLLDSYSVKAGSRSTLMRHLSGGNQQKVVLARELDRMPKILIAAQPSRGLDIAATKDVHKRINNHRKAGGATLLISTELEEVLGLSDRIAVMSRGRIVGVLDNGPDLDLGLLGSLIAGGEG